MGLDEVVGNHNNGSTEIQASSSSWITNSAGSIAESSNSSQRCCFHLLRDNETQLDELNIKHRLRSRSEAKANGTKKGPVLVDHFTAMNIPSKYGNQVVDTCENDSEEAKVRTCGVLRCQISRTPSPNGSHNQQRRRSPSTPRSRPGSPARCPSPAGSLDNQYVEKILWRLKKARKARLYLLQQPGPHSFVVGGDLPEHKYRVMIGPQTCTCSHGPHCIHVLFVMLRVFQVSENDSMLYRKQLRNFEVESLFRGYEKLKQSRLRKCERNVESDSVLDVDKTSTERLNVAEDTSEEGELCSICLLDMVDGESLVFCARGCRNKLHHRCISIWAEECKRQGEPFLCPLCRTPWEKELHAIAHTIETENTLSASMKHNRTNYRRVRNDSKDLCKVTNLFGEMVGADVDSCLYSRDWRMRETALCWLRQEITKKFSQNISIRDVVVRCCCQILSTAATDSVYKVYYACILCLKTLLCHTAISDVQIQEELQPVLDIIIKRSSENQKKFRSLSLSTIVHICRLDPLDGFHFVLKSVFRLTANRDSWNMMLGGLNVLKMLLDEFPDEFQPNQESQDNNGGGERLKAALRFLFAGIRIPHLAVVAMARTVFLSLVPFCLPLPSLLHQLRIIASADTLLNSQLTSLMEAEPASPVGYKPRVSLQRRSSVAYIPSCGAVSPSKDYNEIICTEDQTDDGKKPWWSSTSRTSQGSAGSTSSSRPCQKPVRPNYLPLKKDSGVPSRQVTSLVSPRCSKPSRPHVPLVSARHNTEQVRSPSKRFQNLLAPIKASVISNKRILLPPKKERDFCCLVEVQPERMEQRFNKTESKPDIIEMAVSDSVEGDDKSRLNYVEHVHWRKGAVLGIGAFSTCFQARDVKTGALMAVKQVSFCRNTYEEQEKVKKCIEEEVRMMSRLNHPNVVRCLGATRQESHFNVFVEWMAGGSVSNLLEKFGVFSEPVIISYSHQVLSGLSYLHSNHILHRDLKGANLLVDSSGRHLRIGDFGAAARLTFNSTVLGEFQGQLLGTIAFMAPEVLRGDSYGRSCDLWSVGCCVIEMATSKPPWKSTDVSNHLALIYKIARTQEPPPVPDSLSPLTRDFVLQCLEVNSELRPSAEQLLQHRAFNNI